MNGMRIGAVAKQSNVGIETIRYYERQGLLAQPERRPSGYRQYDESVLARLQFIRRAKQLGFTLSEIKELLGLWFAGDAKCVHVRQRAEVKIAEIEGRIRSLQKMKRSLKNIISVCENRDSAVACPLWPGVDDIQDQGGIGKSTGRNRRKK